MFFEGAGCKINFSKNHKKNLNYFDNKVRTFWVFASQFNYFSEYQSENIYGYL